MGKSGQYIHRNVIDVNVEFNDTYDENRVIEVSLNQANDQTAGALLFNRPYFSGNIQLIRLTGTVAGGASGIILKAYEDASGTKLLLPPSLASFESAVTGTNKGVVFFVNAYHEGASDKLYIFCKTDTGTFTCSQVQIAWYE